LTIIPEAFFIVHKKYERYENLRNEFTTILESFLNHFEQAQPSRLGLRYINQLDLQGPSPLDWQNYISNDLLGLFSYDIEGGSPSRIFHNIEVVLDDFNLRFQFGIHNPDYPAS